MDAIILITYALVLVLLPNNRKVNTSSASDGAIELQQENVQRRTCINETMYKDEEAFTAISSSLIGG